MRKTNETKTINQTLLTTTTTTNNQTQTPIEIALQIDENGMTTASNLYAFLELEPKNYSRWCKTNIINNKFAVENEDYISFVIEDERNPKPKTDYKITSDFAKKLSMTGNTERHEEARKYFIACEQGLKVAAQKLQNQNNQMNDRLIELLSSMDSRLTKLEESQSKKKLPEKKYSRWKTKTFEKLNTLLTYVNTNSDETLKLSDIIHLVINETEDTYNIELSDYVDAYRSEMELDTNPYVIDVINYYKDIRDMYTLTLDSIMERLHIKETGSKRRNNIFDELAAKVDQNNS